MYRVFRYLLISRRPRGAYLGRDFIDVRGFAETATDATTHTSEFARSTLFGLRWPPRLILTLVLVKPTVKIKVYTNPAALSGQSCLLIFLSISAGCGYLWQVLRILAVVVICGR